MFERQEICFSDELSSVVDGGGRGGISGFG